jgi:hypothetical protein
MVTLPTGDVTFDFKTPMSVKIDSPRCGSKPSKSGYKGSNIAITVISAHRARNPEVSGLLPGPVAAYGHA